MTPKVILWYVYIAVYLYTHIRGHVCPINVWSRQAKNLGQGYTYIVSFKSQNRNRC